MEGRSGQAEVTHLAGLEAMRALAHPIRLSMIELLHRKPVSASELARVLGIRYGSAQYHLGVLAREGIACEVGRRSKRGGTEVLYEVPTTFEVAWEPTTPSEVWRAVFRSHVADLARRLEAAAGDRGPADAASDRSVMSDMRLVPEDLAAALDAIDDMLTRLRTLSTHAEEPDSIAFTLALNFFRAAKDEEGP